MTKKVKKQNGDNIYFGKIEEEAVVSYLNCTDDAEREKIYNTYLKDPIYKLIESIMRKYKLTVPEENFENTFNDTASYLITKLDKFKIGKYKAYSYYGTICKNHLIGKIKAYNKELIRNPSYETISNGIVNNRKYSMNPDDGYNIAEECVEGMIERIKYMIDNDQRYNLNPNEIKLGKALINLFSNWDYVLTTDGSNKLNKSTILLFLKDNTGLDTKGIRNNMKKYKNEFLALKKSLL